MRCPFCDNNDIVGEPGTTSCLDCSTRFEIDDRSECIFVDVNSPKLPIDGTVCGLVQAEASKACSYCGETLYPTRQ